jgi:glycine C-acetyltransferase
MAQAFIDHLSSELAGLKSAGLYKSERVITSMQSANIEIAGGDSVLNFCANNYLGLADHPDVVAAAKAASTSTASAWLGALHLRHADPAQGARARMSAFLGMEDTILYSSCFDANGGVFETLLGEEDAIISDELNHASIIDGIRLCKAERYRYATTTWPTCEPSSRRRPRAPLQADRHRRRVLDGRLIAPLKRDLRPGRRVRRAGDGRRQPRGRLRRRAPAAARRSCCGVWDRVDIITGTLGKALGGASGGYTSGKREIVDLLRQRSRPYLFSNTAFGRSRAGTRGRRLVLALSVKRAFDFRAKFICPFQGSQSTHLDRTVFRRLEHDRPVRSAPRNSRPRLHRNEGHRLGPNGWCAF